MVPAQVLEGSNDSFTSCTSRLKKKRLKTLSTYQENIAWIKVADITLEILRGDIRDNVPQSKYWGDVSPCPIGIDAHMPIFYL